MQRGQRAFHVVELVLQLRFFLGENGVEAVNLVVVLLYFRGQGVVFKREGAVDRVGQGGHGVVDDVAQADGCGAEKVLNGGGVVGEGGVEGVRIEAQGRAAGGVAVGIDGDADLGQVFVLTGALHHGVDHVVDGFLDLLGGAVAEQDAAGVVRGVVLRVGGDGADQRIEIADEILQLGGDVGGIGRDAEAYGGAAGADERDGDALDDVGQLIGVGGDEQGLGAVRTAVENGGILGIDEVANAQVGGSAVDDDAAGLAGIDGRERQPIGALLDPSLMILAVTPKPSWLILFCTDARVSVLETVMVFCSAPLRVVPVAVPAMLRLAAVVPPFRSVTANFPVPPAVSVKRMPLPVALIEAVTPIFLALIVWITAPMVL